MELFVQSGTGPDLNIKVELVFIVMEKLNLVTTQDCVNLLRLP